MGDPKTWWRGTELRFQMKVQAIDGEAFPVLQQAWNCRETLEKRWEDVPVFDVDGTELEFSDG